MRLDVRRADQRPRRVDDGAGLHGHRPAGREGEEPPLVDVDVDQGAVAAGAVEGGAGPGREQPGVADDEVDHTGSDPAGRSAASAAAAVPALVRRGRSAR